MPRIHVCSLERLHRTVRETGAERVLTVMKNVGQVRRPAEIAEADHLRLDFADIIQPEPGEVLASEEHVRSLLDFARGWTRQKPLVVHCYAGVSRSTASAFIMACLLRPDTPETDWAERLRAASPTATPNLRLVSLADDLMQRNGRRVTAIRQIGRGEDCFEGVPFSLEIEG